MKQHTYPDHTFENAVRASHLTCQTLWEQRGPKNTAIAWIVAYNCNGCVAIVQTYFGGGWEVYTPLPVNDVKASIDDAIERCTRNTRRACRTCGATDVPLIAIEGSPHEQCGDCVGRPL